ncbi:uracil-DNA glycosylase [Solicola gregarius]|uniref:Type-5 uracil-DNA glycosylase n=1 Tax=Solicola gregarius TaxID=2908642 RepID=A0AA46TKE1_9ACTN|nr:uracil-DNA glycosylase [Solicola gregarius]UYM06497.1 uracil-DNA glycosylase [Solicola gregarius]
MTDLPHPRTGELFGSPVPAGSGWPEDPATSTTPVADGPASVREGAAAAGDLHSLDARISVCQACPRLVGWREDVAVRKRRSFADEPYWGRPVAGFGDERARLLIIGLAPAANGANRTGRVFTGDRSGDWLFASLHRVGLANQAESTSAGDGLRLVGTRMLATVRCAPPANRPTTSERDTCAPWLLAELRFVLPYVRCVVALGGYGWDATLRAMRELGVAVPRPKPAFGHAARVRLGDGAAPVELLGCYHPSQQNTFTGRLTEPMLDDVLSTARDLAGIDPNHPREHDVSAHIRREVGLKRHAHGAGG